MGPIEQFAFDRNYDSHRGDSLVFDAADFWGFARQQDAERKALLVALRLLAAEDDATIRTIAIVNAALRKAGVA